jgi:hypothetical protein
MLGERVVPGGFAGQNEVVQAAEQTQRLVPRGLEADDPPCDRVLGEAMRKLVVQR